MRVVESFVRGKRPDQSLCEDGIFIGRKLVAVIDGVTSHGKLQWNGDTSGNFAQKVLLEYLRTNEDRLAALPASVSLLRMNCFLAKKREEIHPGHLPIEEYPRACIILYNSVVGEVWSYGDCQCRICGLRGDEHGGDESCGDELLCEGKQVDRLLSELRSFVIWSEVRERMALDDELTEGDLLAQIHKRDIGREVVKPLIERQLWLENTPGPFGYPVLNGLNFAVDMVKVWPVPEGAEVVLASDGYPELCRTLEESESRLREVIAEDPLCLGRNAGTKGIMDGMESFDDRAFVRVDK